MKLAQNVVPDALRDQDVQGPLPLHNSSSDKNALIQTIFNNSTELVQISTMSASNCGVSVGDAVLFWERGEGGQTFERTGAVHGMTLSATGHVRIHLTRLYTNEEVVESFQNLKKALPSAVAEIFARENESLKNDKKVTVTIRSNSQTTIEHSNVSKSLPLLHSSKIYENSSPDGSKASNTTAQSSQSILCTGYLDTKRWTVKPLQIDSQGMELILKCSNWCVRSANASMIQHMLQPVREHVFNSVRHLGVRPDPRESILTIACSFPLFAFIVGLPTASLRWFEQSSTWEALYPQPVDLEPMLGKNWFSICKADDGGQIVVLETVTMQYCHQIPGKMQVTLSKVMLCGVGDSATFTFSAPKAVPSGFKRHH